MIYDLFIVYFTNQFTDFWVTLYYSTSTPVIGYVTNTTWKKWGITEDTMRETM